MCGFANVRMCGLKPLFLFSKSNISCHCEEERRSNLVAMHIRQISGILFYSLCIVTKLLRASQ